MPNTDISSYNDLFLKSANNHLTEVKKLLSNIQIENKKQTFEEIYRHIHSLKGSSSVMGVNTIVTLCDEINSLILNSKNNQLKEKIIDIELITSKIYEIISSIQKNSSENNKPI